MNSKLKLFDGSLTHLSELLSFWLSTNPTIKEIEQASESVMVLTKNFRGRNKKIIEEIIPKNLYPSSFTSFDKRIASSEVKKAYSVFCQKLVNEVVNDQESVIMSIGLSSYIFYQELIKYLPKEKVFNIIPFSRKYILGTSNGPLYLELLDLTSQALLLSKKKRTPFYELYDLMLQEHTGIMIPFSNAFKPWLRRISYKTKRIILIDSGFFGSLLYPLSSILRKEGYKTEIWLFARYIWLDTFLDLKNCSFTTNPQLLLSIEKESAHAYKRKI